MIMLLAFGMILMDLSTCLGIILVLSTAQYLYMSFTKKIESSNNKLSWIEKKSKFTFSEGSVEKQIRKTSKAGLPQLEVLSKKKG